MIEVEIKLPVHRDLKAELLTLGFTQNMHICERDTYFDRRDGEIRTSGQALRIRTEQNLESGEVVSLVTFKGKRMDQETVSRPEYETRVEDGEVFRKILEGMGYYPVQPEVVKERIILVKEKMTACLDHVQGLGDFLELEIMIDEFDNTKAGCVVPLERAKQKTEELKAEALGCIEALLTMLGYTLADTTQNSYLSQLQGLCDQ